MRRKACHAATSLKQLINELIMWSMTRVFVDGRGK
jgi:hypothetical protein